MIVNLEVAGTTILSRVYLSMIIRLIKTTYQDTANATITKYSFSYQSNGNLSFKTDMKMKTKL